MDEYISRDVFSLNVVAESFSRLLSFAGGVLSSMVLYRSISWSWSVEDYATIKVLVSAGQVLLPIALLGFSGALTRYVAAHSNDRVSLGRTIGNSILVVTIAFVGTALFSTFFGLDQVLVLYVLKYPLEVEALKLYWFFVLITLLPTAYLSLAKAAFTGIQQMKRGLVTETVYNSVRIVILLLLFSQRLVAIISILWLNLGLAVLASLLAFGILSREMKRNAVPWLFRPSMRIIRGLAGLSAVFLVGTLVQANFDYVTVLWMSYFGTPDDVASFSIAKAVSQTVLQVVTSPIGVLAPILTMEYALGRRANLERKFMEGYRMIIPTLAFAGAVQFAFAFPILRILFGWQVSRATYFLQLLSFNSVFAIVPAIYSYIYLAADDRKGLLMASVLQGLIQTVWIVLMAPVIGVAAIAMIWVPYIPFFFVQHEYSRRKHGITMRLSTVAGGIAIGLVFLVLMSITAMFVNPILATLPVPQIVQAAVLASIAVPFWYLFIAAGTLLKVLTRVDLENMVKVLKVIPPAWWVSKPIITWLIAVSERGHHAAASHEESETSRLQ